MRVNFDQLWTLGGYWDKSSIEKSFNWCLQRLSEYIGLPPVKKNVSIEILEGKYPVAIVHENIFTSWIKRDATNGRFVLKIYKDCGAFLPFVLLRELYACFLPETVKSYHSVLLVVYYIVLEEGRFAKQESGPWRAFVDSKRKHKDHQDEDQERVNQYFKNKIHHQKLLNTFFSYLYRNESIINPSDHDFASVLFQVYVAYTAQFLLVLDNIEALRLTSQIYSTVKSFISAKDYENYFEQFVSNGTFNTYLKKSAYSTFLKNLKNTVLAPTYALSWSYFGGVVYHCFIKFHPLLKKHSIVKVLSEIEFIYFNRRTYASLSHDVMISAFLPQIYEEDFTNFFDRLKKLGYIVDCFLYKVQDQLPKINLNAFKHFYSSKGLIDAQNPEYDSKWFVEKYRVMDLEKPTEARFSVFDFLITDFFRVFSVEGIGYEERKNQLQMYKSELRSYKQKVRSLNANIKLHFKEVIENQEVKEFFVSFANKHKVHGFFYVFRLLQSLYSVAKALEKRDIASNGNLSKNQFEEALTRGLAFPQLRSNLLLTNQAIKNHVKLELLPLYYQKREDFKTIIDRYYKSSELLSSCANLQLYDVERILMIVNNDDIAQNIFDAREQKQFEYYDKIKEENITINLLNSKLSTLLDDNAITPSITATLNYEFCSVMGGIVRYAEPNMKFQSELQPYFGGSYFSRLINISGNHRVIFFELRTGYLTPTERYSLTSIIYNAFKSDMFYFKFLRGPKYVPFVTLRKYYDFPQKKYFYAKDLFPNLLLFTKKEFGKVTTHIEEKLSFLWPHLLSKDNSLEILNEATQKRIKATIYCDLPTVKELKKFAQSIEKMFSQFASFAQIKNKPFFKNHVKSIKFLPMFSRFGFSQYHLYFYPTDVDQINFKLLLNNSFQSLKCSVGVETAPSFLIKYIYPYRTPNMRYVNRATKTLRIIREYCAFRLIRGYFNFHANHSFSSEGWEINFNQFEIHIQKILFTNKWEKPPEYLKECNLEIVTPTPLGPDSNEFSNLQRIYSRKPIDLKNNLFFKNDSRLKDFSALFSKNLVCPYVKFKSLNFHEKIRFILPNISERITEKVLRIFTFFNYCEAYKIEGKLYVQGLEDEIEFDNGLYVKLYLPGYKAGSVENSDSIGALLNVLEETFEVLGIEHYIVLNNTIKPESFLNYVFGAGIDLKGYNPLLNLKWDEKNMAYRNHKLYDEENNPIYPSLQETEK